ncbi:MAG: cation:proton antiporter, partial [Halalkalicoccus sp.]|nr:cation:proton antiporter [Halalkalicoccus sp.]
MPFTMAAFTVGAAGMAGIPLIAGFVSKYYMLIGGLGAGGIGVIGAEGATMSPLMGTIFSGSLIVSGLLNIAYFWPIVYTAYFESENDHDAKPLLEFPMGGKPESYGVSVGRLTDGGTPVDENADHDGGYAVDRFPSDHADADDHEHADHGGGPPAEGWGRRRPWTESTWLMLAPIGLIATGAVVLGVVPGQAVFFDLAVYIVETVTGVVVP